MSGHANHRNYPNVVRARNISGTELFVSTTPVSINIQNLENRQTILLINDSSRIVEFSDDENFSMVDFKLFSGAVLKITTDIQTEINLFARTNVGSTTIRIMEVS